MLTRLGFKNKFAANERGKNCPLNLCCQSEEVAVSDEDDDLDDIEMDEEESVDEVKPAASTDLEARRRLEARLEERRLSKMIQDYDFDDIA